MVTGSTNGNFKELFTKAKQIHEKYGPFDVHLCIGNFFDSNMSEESIQPLLKNEIEGIYTSIINYYLVCIDSVYVYISSFDDLLYYW